MKLNNHRKILIIKLIDDAAESGNWGKSDAKKLNSLKRRLVASLANKEE